MKAAFTAHIAETRTHVSRLEEIFKDLDFEPDGHKCAAVVGLIKQGEGLINSDSEPKVLDAALIAASQRIEHCEMAGYGTARTYAEKLGDQNAADVLQLTLNEEGLASQKLTRLAERKINFLTRDRFQSVEGVADSYRRASLHAAACDRHRCLRFGRETA